MEISLKKSLIIPAIIIGALMIGAVITLAISGGGFTEIAFTIAGAVLIYLTTVQIVWGSEPIVSIIDLSLKKPFGTFGLIFELDLDGIIWFLTVKLLLSILSVVLMIFTVILGLLIALAVSPFSFPFALYGAIKHPEDLGW